MQEASTVERYIKKEKKKRPVPAPKAIQIYEVNHNFVDGWHQEVANIIDKHRTRRPFKVELRTALLILLSNCHKISKRTTSDPKIFGENIVQFAIRIADTFRKVRFTETEAITNLARAR